MNAIVDVPLDQIVAGDNYRKTFSTQTIEELAESIVQNGLLQPIVLRPDGEGFRIVAGERRFRAHRHLEAPTIRATIRGDLDDATESIAMLVENVEREDPNPIEEARGYQSHLDTFDLTPEELAKSSGIKLARVNQRLSLLNLHPEIQELTHNGQLGVGFALEMVKLDADRQLVAFKAITAKPTMGWWTFNALCKELLREQSEQTMFDPDSFFQIDELVEKAAKSNRSIKGLAAIVERLVTAVEDLGGSDQYGDLLTDAKAML